MRHLTQETKFFLQDQAERPLFLRKGSIIRFLYQDLSYLNRDLKNVIIVDFNEKKVPKQPENLIIMKEYKGENEDKELYELLQFLERKII